MELTGVGYGRKQQDTAAVQHSTIPKLTDELKSHSAVRKGQLTKRPTIKKE